MGKIFKRNNWKKKRRQTNTHTHQCCTGINSGGINSGINSTFAEWELGINSFCEGGIRNGINSFLGPGMGN